jgi:heat-inducible transcriptional repressor
MSPSALTDREKRILELVVEIYVRTATPVSSKYLAKRFGLGLSPATIRHVLGELEVKGYLSQPHISAGRIPSDKGYRFYVDHLMKVRTLAKKERAAIRAAVAMSSVDVRRILEAASGVLGNISSQLGVVMEPLFFQGIFQKLELVSVSDSRLMVVISIKSGLVKTIMMEVESGLSRHVLAETSTILNERLSGLSVREVKETIDERLRDVRGGDEKLIRYIVKSSNRLFDFSKESDIMLSGALNITSSPEFSDRNYAEKILSLISDKEGLWDCFADAFQEDFSIRIGTENPGVSFDGCSMITASYHVGDVAGRVGVVGPTRMSYKRIVPLVDYMGQLLTNELNVRLS